MPRRRRSPAAAAFVEDDAEETSLPPEFQASKKKKGKEESSASAASAASAASTSAEDSPAKNTRGQTSASPPKELPVVKSRKSIKRPLTQEEEDDLVEWLQENSFMYNKASADFKLRDKKARTWLEKEQELGLNTGDLSLVWYPNMRTQYSKLIKTGSKSGSGLQERTARQTWLLEKFAFIRPYLVQLRQQRGSKFAEKRKELGSSDVADDDVVELESDSSAPSSVSGARPKPASTLVSSLNEELSSLKDSMGQQDKAARTGQFLIHMMRDMTEPTRQEFILTVTKLAIEAVQKDKADLVRQHQQHVQQQQQVFVVPTRRPPSAAAGSASQHQQHQIQQDFQLATNIAASVPAASRTPALSHYHHLQPPNVQPMLQIPQAPQVLKAPSTSSASSSAPSTSSFIRQAMNIASTHNSSFPTFNVEVFDDTLMGLPSPLEQPRTSIYTPSPMHKEWTFVLCELVLF